MIRNFFIALLAIGLLTISGCKGATAGVNIPGISREEAFKFLSANAKLFRCGDRYLLSPSIELKDPTFQIERSSDLTQADSLNGVTWDAMVSLRAPFFRSALNSGDGALHWGDWQASDDPNRMPWYLNEFRVKNGRLEPASTQGNPFNCSNIPPG